MRVIATAGHVDHGKSTLVRALTGIEPDRWDEEKRRGLTIDLGFAWTTLPGGETVAFVDVPGHERFIANMLAGVGPAPAVMLVVAADEGWRRQSQEHLDAIAALGIRHGLLVISRADLAGPAPALREARERLRGTGLEHAEAVAVSAHTGEGIPELRAALDRLCAALPTTSTDTRTRMWLDRSFSVKGAGTVVTGTLVGGSVRSGDTVQLLTSEGTREATVRGLESLDTTVGSASATARVAANLRGVPAGEITRGDALVTPGVWHLTTQVDARLRLVRGVTAQATTNATLPEPARTLPDHVMVHVGTWAQEARVRPLGAEFMRLTWRTPLPLEVGDRLILRDPGRQEVLAGAAVLDVDPPELQRRGAAARRAEELSSAPTDPHGEPVFDAAREVAQRGAAAHVARLGGLSTASPPPGVHAIGAWWVSDERRNTWIGALGEVVRRYAEANPGEARMPLQAAAAATALPEPTVARLLASAAGLEFADGYLAPPGAQASLGAAEAAISSIEQRLATTPFAAPEKDELTDLGVGAAEIAVAVRLGRLIDLGDRVLLTPKAPALAMRELAALPGAFTTSQARQALGTTRRVVIPLLELLDAKGWTRRVDTSHREVVR